MGGGDVGGSGTRGGSGGGVSFAALTTCPRRARRHSKEWFNMFVAAIGRGFISTLFHGKSVPAWSCTCTKTPAMCELDLDQLQQPGKA